MPLECLVKVKVLDALVNPFNTGKNDKILSYKKQKNYKRAFRSGIWPQQHTVNLGIPIRCEGVGGIEVQEARRACRTRGNGLNLNLGRVQVGYWEKVLIRKSGMHWHRLLWRWGSHLSPEVLKRRVVVALRDVAMGMVGMGLWLD